MAETLHEIIERNVILAFIVHGSINAAGYVNEDGVFIATRDDDQPAKALDANDVHRKLGTAAARALTDRLPDIDFEDKPKARGNGQLEVNSEAFARNRSQHREQEPPVPVKILTYDEMLALPEACFAVEGVIVYRGKNVIFGVSNTFKSFHAVDLGQRFDRTELPRQGREEDEGLLCRQ